MTNGSAGLLLISLFIYSTGAFECDKTAVICQTKLVISQFVTMLHPTEWAVYPSGGKLYRYDVTITSAATPINVSEVIVGDGYEKQKLVVVANMSMPGPDIIVYEGQRLIVQVENRLHSEAVTIHWHGIPQKGSPYMDGVPFITQCPVNPGSIFTYDFIATPRGTHWYHSHVGGQRSKGLFGALIIRKNETNPLEEHVVQIQEWSHDYGPDEAYHQWKGGHVFNRVRVARPQVLDGTLMPFLHIDSALINGKGRLKSSNNGQYNSAPLQVYDVVEGQRYRFRLINVGASYPFRVSVDNHTLSVVAVDGNDVRPMQIESLIIHPGDRFDFILNTSEPVTNYWIRGQSLDVDKEIVAWAILRYNGAIDKEPTSSSTKIPCTGSSKCHVLNCPFLFYPQKQHTICHTIDELRSLHNDDPAPTFVKGQSKEYLFHTAVKHLKSHINGRRFMFPVVSAISQPDAITASCNLAGCSDEQICSCTHAVTLDHGDTIQLVLSVLGGRFSWGHPMHLHGHSFYILKMGYGTYNETNAQFISASNDIQCVGNACLRQIWTNSSWHGDDIPGLELNNPPRKDTVFVPRGGYVVIRFKADNPGLWFFHCHTELHSVDLMSMFFNESFHHLPRKPNGFPQCNNFLPVKSSEMETTRSTDAYSENSKSTVKQAQTTAINLDEAEMIELRSFFIVLFLLVGIVLVQLIFNVFIYKKLKANSREMSLNFTNIMSKTGKTNQGYRT